MRLCVISGPISYKDLTSVFVVRQQCRVGDGSQGDCILVARLSSISQLGVGKGASHYKYIISICPSVHPSIYPSATHLSVHSYSSHPTVRSAMYLSTQLFIYHPLIHPYNYPMVQPSSHSYLPICSSFLPPVHSSTNQSIFPSISSHLLAHPSIYSSA